MKLEDLLYVMKDYHHVKIENSFSTVVSNQKVGECIEFIKNYNPDLFNQTVYEIYPHDDCTLIYVFDF